MIQSKKFLDKKDLRDSISVVVGTRPGIIKFSPVIRALEKQRCDYFIVHTGQHYTYNMDKKFFDDLKLPEPKYKNDTVKKEKLHGSQTGEMIKDLEEIFIKEKPRIVIVGGDANTNLAGALAARKLRISVAHMEAGLRSGDWRMPEEHNRVMIDHISDFLFAPTKKAKMNLVKDNVKGKIFVVGNTIVDAINQNLELAKKTSDILKILKLLPGEYFVITLHREENVDSRGILQNILKSLKYIGIKYKTKIIFPIHPRTLKRLKEFNLEKDLSTINNIEVINPLGYLDFLVLLSNAKIVLTDSGGIQEESCILNVPCVTLRDNTERPETVHVGANIIAGTEPRRILSSVGKAINSQQSWENPFGDGKTGEKIIKTLIQEVFH